MELQFQKQTFPCMQLVLQNTQEQEQTQEVRLTDGMPDIGRVIGAWGQVLLRSKQWQGTTLSVSGGVMVWVLYEAEDRRDNQIVDGWIPFQMKWDHPETAAECKLVISCQLRFVDARNTSARKIMVRTGVASTVQAYAEQKCEQYIPCDVPGDVHLLCVKRPVLLPAEVGEKSYEIQEELSLAANDPHPEQVVYCRLCPEVHDRKIMGDKAIFRGTAWAHLLYRAENGQLCVLEREVPFSQYDQLDREYDQDGILQVIPAVTSLEVEVDSQGQIQLKAAMTGQYVVYERHMYHTVEDAYSSRRDIEAQTHIQQVPAVLDIITQPIHAEVSFDAEFGTVVDAGFIPEATYVLCNDTGVAADLSGRFKILCIDMEGSLQERNMQWQGNWDLNTLEVAKVDFTIRSGGKTQIGVNELRTDMVLECIVSAEQGIQTIASLHLGEERPADPERPSLILRRVGKDSLWQIAKQTGSTIEAIQQANNLTEEPDGEQILLIPIS